MSSYIYMKILESRPERYDRGISWLSLGQADRIKKRIADEYAGQGMRVLDVGAGTGTFAILAAARGASVFGFDVSAGMLEVARKKLKSAGLEEKVTFEEMGVAGMDRLQEQSFDLVVSMLVFSELSPDEQNYALKQAYRLLKPDGRLALADETRPWNPVKLIVYFIIRLPLFIITYILTQTSTRAVTGLEDRVAECGFRTEKVERSMLDSFVYITAVKEARI